MRGRGIAAASLASTKEWFYFYILHEALSIAHTIHCTLKEEYVKVRLRMLEVRFADLPNECLVAIARCLESPEILRLATTCKRLARLLSEDEVWIPPLRAWLALQDPRAGVHTRSPESLRDALRLKTMRGTCQALHTLGAWPCGLWCPVKEESTPSGSLYWVDLPSPHLMMRQPVLQQGFAINPLCFDYVDVAIRRPWPAPFVRSRRLPGIRMFVGATGGGHFCGELAHVWFNTGLPEEEPITLNSCQGEPLLKIKHISDSGEVCIRMYHRAAPLSVPLSLLPPHCPPPGTYTGVYGGHGIEILKVELLRAEDSGPLGCGLGGVRLHGLKVIGDPNVPAGQTSFIVEVDDDDTTSTWRPGPYDAVRDDPCAVNGQNPRPIVSYDGQIGVRMIDMEARPVSAVFPRAFGQINKTPGRWDPEWVCVTVVVYDVNEEDPWQARFGVIFEDLGLPHRHVIDFYPFRKP